MVDDVCALAAVREAVAAWRAHVGALEPGEEEEGTGKKGFAWLDSELCPREPHPPPAPAKVHHSLSLTFPDIG